MEQAQERLMVALEQLEHIRQSAQNDGLAYRAKIAAQAVQDAQSVLKQARLITTGLAVPNTDQGGFPVKVIWERPRKGQKFEAQLLGSGRIRLQDGRGPFTPSGACRALVGGNWDGWREWKYWQEEEQPGKAKWLPIGELREAGYFQS